MLDQKELQKINTNKLIVQGLCNNAEAFFCPIHTPFEEDIQKSSLTQMLHLKSNEASEFLTAKHFTKFFEFEIVHSSCI